MICPAALSLVQLAIVFVLGLAAIPAIRLCAMAAEAWRTRHARD